MSATAWLSLGDAETDRAVRISASAERHQARVRSRTVGFGRQATGTVAQASLLSARNRVERLLREKRYELAVLLSQTLLELRVEAELVDYFKILGDASPRRTHISRARQSRHAGATHRQSARGTRHRGSG